MSLYPRQTETLYGAPFGVEGRLLAEAARRAAPQQTPVLYVAQDDIRARVVADVLGFFAPDINILFFPAWDCLPYDRVSPHPDVVSERIATLSRLLKKITNPTVVFTTIPAIAQRTLPPEILRESSLNIRVGDQIPVEKLRHFLTSHGFITASTVREAGEFAVRGGIVDLFAPDTESPVRIDFFGDEIESLRLFDPLTQTTTGKLDLLSLSPISEVLLDPTTISHFRSNYRALFGAMIENDPLYEAVTDSRKFTGLEHWLGLFYPRLASLLDYAPQAPVYFDDQAEESLQARVQQVEDFYKARLSLFEASKRAKKKNGEQQAAVYKPAPSSQIYMTVEEVGQTLENHPVFRFSPFAKPDLTPADQAGPTSTGSIQTGAIPTGTLPTGTHKDLGFTRARDFADARAQASTTGAEGDLYATVARYAAEMQATGKHVVLACYSQGSAERLAGILRAHSFNVALETDGWSVVRKKDIKLISLVVLGLEHGFVAPDLALITEQDILGDRMIRAPRKRRVAAQFQLELGSLATGDFVVHAEHGIGRYEGLETLSALDSLHDCVRLIYDGGDKLFVPVENLDVLTRYGGADCGAVLDRLGGVAWQARKARVKNRLKDMAEALLKIAADRHLKKGELIQIPESVYQEFAARFPYPETEDQSRAIQDVLDDLAGGKPMDRLVCGDVGFGKTEVALRAAFAAVQSGLQVAVVVPTTLLARQHYNNFTQRFSGFPIHIAQISRMVGARESKQAKDLLKEGKIDIVVGTHALLSKEIGFQRLGLLIIDEEQHFGVKQKEKLKELRTDVHVLTLTATPIPRTLQLALAGVRELSLIATPPVDRLAVRTFVLPYDPLVIREALMREHYRGGQSFYVCPRVEDLAGVAEELRELVPEVKIVTAHGRMTPTELEDIMTAFDARKFDILLATNIVESGLDIPNANTIVLHRADMFGLAQLYQLRGRVGRGKLRGYAYFTYNPVMPLSQTAQQRLEVLQTLDQLGAGFQLASHDMDIRGAGNILGEEQSGHVREVGVELYQQMLEDAVAAARTAAHAPTQEKGSQAANQENDRWTPQINIGLSVLIPETYVTDLNVRLGLYRRLAEGVDESEIESIAAEMIDRFGPLPEEVENLLQTVAIKALCRKAGIAKLDAGPKGAVIAFHHDTCNYPDRLIAWITEEKGTVKVRPDQKLTILRAWDDMPQRLAGIKKILTTLASFSPAEAKI